jgi:hypothetical protein
MAVPPSRRFATWLSCADERRWKTRPPRHGKKRQKKCFCTIGRVVDVIAKLKCLEAH